MSQMNRVERVRRFLELVTKVGAVTFGDINLKAKEEKSPYFFKSDRFHVGSDSALLSNLYATTIVAALGRDVVDGCIIFGPAYKGISIASTLASWMSLLENVTVSWSHDRKEEKDHGDKGIIVGCPLSTRKVILIDDVITSGGSLREAKSLVEKEGGHVVAVCVAFDRQQAYSDITEAKQFELEFKVPVFSIATFSDWIRFSRSHSLSHVSILEKYQKEHCIIE